MLGPTLAMEKSAREAVRRMREVTRGLGVEPSVPILSAGISAGIADDLIKGIFPSIARADLRDVIKDQLTGIQAGINAGSSNLAMIAGLNVFDPKYRQELKPIIDSLTEFTRGLTSQGSEAFMQLSGDLRAAESIRQSFASTREALDNWDDDDLPNEHPVLSDFIRANSEKLNFVKSRYDYWDEQWDSTNGRLDSIEGLLLAQGREQYYQWLISLIIGIFFGMLPYILSPTREAVAEEVGQLTSGTPEEPSGPMAVDRDQWIQETVRLYSLVGNFEPGLRVLVRDAPLRVEPWGKAKEQCRLEVGSRVRKLNEAGDWYLVETVPLEEGQDVELGWLYRHHLK